MSDQTMNYFVTGANGGLGTSLMEALRTEPGSQAVGVDLPELDVADPAATRARVLAERPGVIVNCASLTNVDGCETDRDLAWRVNADAAGHLAAAAKEAGAVLVQIGTDYVFDGRLGRPYREDDAPNPLGVYGASKLAGEERARAAGCDLLVVRTSRLFGPGGKNFVRIILGKAREARRLELVTDQRGAPTYAPDLARAILHLLRQGRRGLYHVTNAGACNWLEWAREIFAAAGMERELVPVTAARFAARAARPPDSTLDCAKADATGLHRRTWQEATRELLKQPGMVPGS
jgi:dTDP-4-dehydrorhamnose reductase